MVPSTWDPNTFIIANYNRYDHSASGESSTFRAQRVFPFSLNNVRHTNLANAFTLPSRSPVRSNLFFSRPLANVNFRFPSCRHGPALRFCPLNQPSHSSSALRLPRKSPTSAAHLGYFLYAIPSKRLWFFFFS